MIQQDTIGSKRIFQYRAPLLALLAIVAVLVYFNYMGASFRSSIVQTFEVAEQEPFHTGQFKELSQERKEVSDKNNLSYIAEALRIQIERIQSSNCSEGYSLNCGHYNEGCGLGCQLHHRTACLIISYAMGIPLIHNSKRAWPFDSPWEAVYQQLGSNCSTNDRTIKVEWNGKHKTPIMTFENKTEIKYVLEHGIPVDGELHRILTENHPEPFRWLVGQFLKYTTRLSDELTPAFEQWFQSLERPRVGPFIGFHVRRTDKITEAKDSFHKIDEYIKPTEEYLSKTNQDLVIPHTVYIASDDHTVLEEAQRKYSTAQWRFIGQKMNVTFKNAKERRSRVALVSAVQDLAALSNCEYVVCGLSSNLCRLVFEILNANYPDASERLKSLDQQYRYVLIGHTIPEKLIPVNGPQGVQLIPPGK